MRLTPYGSDAWLAPPSAAPQARGLPPDAAREMWLSMPIFDPALERPQSESVLRSIVSGYSGSRWVTADRGQPFSPPAIERLGEICAPTLVIVGERDTEDFHRIATTIEERVAGSRKVVLPGVGHMANLESPVFINKVLLEFLESVSAPSRR